MTTDLEMSHRPEQFAHCRNPVHNHKRNRRVNKSALNISMAIKYRRIKRAKYTERIKQAGKPRKIVVGKTEETRLFGRPEYKSKDNTKINLK
jgi:hypothetical protein